MNRFHLVRDNLPDENIVNDFGFEKHYIRGKAKMQTSVGFVTAVMMAMALGHVWAGRIEQIRSLVRTTQTSPLDSDLRSVLEKYNI